MRFEDGGKGVGGRLWSDTVRCRGIQLSCLYSEQGQGQQWTDRRGEDNGRDKAWGGGREAVGPREPCLWKACGNQDWRRLGGGVSTAFSPEKDKELQP